jgi:pyrophosphatase PpaX
MCMKISAVLFDFDGTVMDTNQLIIDSWQHTFRVLEGRERPLEDIIATLGEPLDVTMGRIFPDAPQEATDIYRSYHVGSFTGAAAPFPGVEATLARLKADGYAMGLVTSRMRRTTWMGIGKYGLDRYFDVVVACEDAEACKPDPAPVLKALEGLGKQPQEAVMVGDAMSDVRCARAAGVVPILVGWSLAATAEDRDGPDGPDFVIEAADELAGVIESINRERGGGLREAPDPPR